MSNSKIPAVIIDDEQSARRILRSMLENNCPTIEIMGEADSVLTGRALIKKVNPQVIFLDIEMPSGTGFDLLKDFDENPAEIIFITAHDKYAINAIKIFALDYLLKPINRQELIEAVKKIQNKDIQSTHQILKLLKEQIDSKRQHAERLVIPSITGLEIIKVTDILYCEADRNYTIFYLSNKEKLLSSKTLKEYERILPPTIFIRVHQKYLVNINFVKTYLKGRGGTLIMTNGKNIAVSHSKKTAVIDALN